MNRDILALDFYGQSVVAAVASLDETTDTLRIRHVLQCPSQSFSCALVRDIAGAKDSLNHIFTEMAPYTRDNPSVWVGVRGNFLSFQHRTGFTFTELRSHLIRPRDVDKAIDESIPKDLEEASLSVVDVLPQSYVIDDQAGVIDPTGMYGCCLGAETFISLGVSTHLANLRHVLESCECENFQWVPSCISLGEMALTNAEKAGATLLVDLGETSISALLYHKNSLMEAWELPFGLDRVAEGIADQLQNDTQTALQVLRNYEPDPITDEVIEVAAKPMLSALHKELVQSQSLYYVQHPPTHIVLSGQGALPVFQKMLKNKLNARKVRLCSFDHLISDCDIESPIYDGVLALLQQAVLREQAQAGPIQTKENGLLDKFFSKLGFN